MKTPPISTFTDPTAERRILAAMLFHAGECIGDYVGRVNPEHFTVATHRQLFEILVNRWNGQLQVNPQEVKKVLCQPEVENSLEILTLINQLVCKEVDHNELELMVHRITEQRLLREINRITCQLSALVGEPDQDEARHQLVDTLHRLIPELASYRHSKFATIKEHVMETVDDLEHRYESRRGIYEEWEKIPTGIQPVDTFLSGGLDPGDLMVIVGESCTGKTALAISCLLRMAVECKQAAAFYSLDLSEKEVVRRFIASGANQKHLNLLRGDITEHGFPLIIDQAYKMSEASISLAHFPKMTLVELWGIVQKQKDRFDIRSVVIDPVNFLDELGSADTWVRLKEMALQLDVAVIALCDLPKMETLSSEAGVSKSPCLNELSLQCDLLLRLERPHPGEGGVERLPLSVWQAARGYIGQASMNFNPSTGKMAAINAPIHQANPGSE